MWGRFRSLHGVEPAEADRVTLAAEQAHGFIQWQPDHIAVRADDLDDEGSGDALRRVAAGLAAPLARRQVSLDIIIRQPFEAHARFHQSLAKRLLRRDQA